MRKTFSMIALLALLSLITGKAYADPYTVDFNTEISTTDHDFKVASGWGHIVSSYTDDEYETYYVDYSYDATGGVDGTGALKVGDQTALGSGWYTGSATDLLVTPKITGASSIYVKKTKNSGTVKFYTVTKSGTTYTKGDEISVTLPTLSTSDYVQVSIPSQNGAYIGIYGTNVELDNFSADAAEIELNKALTINSVTNNSGSTVNCDKDGNFHVNFTVSLTNSGDIDLNPGDSGYSLSLINYDGDTVYTQPITTALAVGATMSVTLDATLSYAEHSERDRYNVVENISKTYKYGARIEPKPYVPEINLRYDGSRMDSGESLDFGSTYEAVTRTLTLKNSGAAPLNVTSITVPNGYTTDAVLPITLAADSSTTFNVTLTAEEPGIYNDSLRIKADDLSDFTLYLTGITLDSTLYRITFEDQKIPAGCIAGDNWSIAQRDYASSDNAYCMSNSVSGEETKFITPLLEVKDGDVMSFDAARTGYTSSDANLKVYYSADRKNWTLARAIANSELSSENSYSYMGVFTSFTIDNIPAGQWYIAFEAGYASIDNIYGFRKVDVAHDFLFTSTTVPSTGSVNTASTFKATVKNNNDKDEAAESYKVELHVGDQTVAAAANPAIASTGSEDFELSFTPHEAGTYPVYFTVTADDDVVTSDTDTIIVAAETSTKDVKVGDVYDKNYAGPVYVYDKHSETESIYTAEQLGLTNGAKINSITWKGYNTHKELTTHVKIYLANVSDTTLSDVTALDTANAVRCYDADYTFPMAGSSDETADMLTITLSEPFVYTGQSLMVIGKADGSSYARVYFERTNIENQSYGRENDNDITSQDFSSKYLPVIHLGIATEPATVTGKVTNGTDGIEGAKVTLTSGDVLYSATTDAEGAYSLTVFQTDKKYALTATADGYETYTSEDSLSISSDMTQDITLTMTDVTVTVTNAGYATLYYSDRALVVPDRATAYTYSVADGKLNVTMTYDAGNVIPKATAVVVKAAPADYTFQIASEAGTAPTANNLYGYDTDKTTSVDGANKYYMLSCNKEGTEPGFYWGAENGAAFVSAAHKAFLVVFDDTAAKSYTFNDVVDSINNIHSTTNNGDVYSLSGVKMNKGKLPAGVYIRNGKKFIVR